ncbi:hypothetical protein J5N97_025796 [Dioscorea zingiberensis]|uniref:Inositol oxygenase n=1 Tax=Dioscorea zingiberensis TaxID=325984 RepID=A0A9D5C1W8_9LILI|nr:hypothetical protein J5N97_025796 [Dioscorea zingiberensis]
MPGTTYANVVGGQSEIIPEKERATQLGDSDPMLSVDTIDGGGVGSSVIQKKKTEKSGTPTVTYTAGKKIATNRFPDTGTHGGNNMCALCNKEMEKMVDGGFVVPETNSFGHTFRDYDAESERNNTVEEFYSMNHTSQTYDFVKKMREEYGKLGRMEMSIWEACELLNEVVDESDPDLEEPQIQHLLQTAEAIRKDYPQQDWLHMTALIHDLGKVLLHATFGQHPQWAVVGDLVLRGRDDARRSGALGSVPLGVVSNDQNQGQRKRRKVEEE